MGGLSGPGVPDLIGLSREGGTTPSGGVPEGIGYAPTGVQAAAGINQVLQGLRQGYQSKVLKQYDQAQTQYNVAITALQNSQKQIKALQDAGVTPEDPAYKAAIEASTKQQAEANKAWEAINKMVTGGGSKGAGGSWAEGGGVKGVIGHLLNRIMPNPFNPLNEPAWGELSKLSTQPGTLGTPSTFPNSKPASGVPSPPDLTGMANG